MNAVARTFVALFIAVAVIFTSTGVAAAAVVAATGFMTIEVESRGSEPDLYLPVPVALVGAALGIAEIAMPPEAKARMRRETAEARPFLEAISRGLSDLPDSTLVHVESDREQVSVSKRGGLFEIEVHSADGEHVRVSVPVGVIDRVTRFLTE